ncbi:MAG TPA: glycosyltransferase [Chloroflexota bacterium]|nr:glycosyltransferase [Chloroflexota bacterium]
MRIGWIVPGFQGKADEPGIPALTALASALSHSHDLHVYTVRFPPRDSAYLVDGVPVVSFGAAPEPGNRFHWRVASARRWLRVLSPIRDEHARRPFDALHGFWATEPGMLACVAGHLLGIPVTVSVCGGELASVRVAGYGNQLHRLERAQVGFSLQLAAAIGVGSDDSRSRVLSRFPWLAAKIRDLPLGFDPHTFALSATPPNSNTVVCVASWSPVKGHPLLLDGFRLLARRLPSARLILVGERTDGPEARAAIAERGLTTMVQPLGYLRPRGVATVVAGAHASVITSWHEAECLAVVESLASGTPIVATPVGIARQLLRNPALGALIPARSPEAVFAALDSVLRTTADEVRQTRLARAAAVEYLAVERVAERFAAHYQAIADGR